MQSPIPTLKKISIRGRMAIAVTCLEIALRDLAPTVDFDKKYIHNLIADLWEFTSSDRLNFWDETTFKYGTWESVDLPELTSEELEAFHKLDVLPEYLVKMIDYTIDLGRCNLYGGVSGNSPCTLENLVRVMALMETHHHALPDLKRFKKYSFKSIEVGE